MNDNNNIDGSSQRIRFTQSDGADAATSTATRRLATGDDWRRPEHIHKWLFWPPPPPPADQQAASCRCSWRGCWPVADWPQQQQHRQVQLVYLARRRRPVVGVAAGVGVPRTRLKSPPLCVCVSGVQMVEYVPVQSTFVVCAAGELEVDVADDHHHNHRN